MPEATLPPKGQCQCGCGGVTRIAPQTRAARGWIKDEPLRFLPGHNQRVAWSDPAVRLWKHVRKGDVCWNWMGTRTKRAGYGMFYVGPNRSPVYVHRFAYELLVGPIPGGLTLDHLCRNTRCVNPDHLEAVTLAENIRRARAASRG